MTEPGIFGLRAVAAAGVSLYFLWISLRIGRRPADYPPGPPTLPVLGNLHLVIIHIPTHGPALQDIDSFSVPF
jgi:hypothetical protein